MTQQEKQDSLEIAKQYFTKLATSYEKKLKSIKLNDFTINPFTVNYLAHATFGNANPDSIAKTIVYPRIFGTSLSTSFGTQMQRFCSEAGFSKPSGVSGMDIEFIDKITKKQMYCQLKSGPNTINSKDVDPMCNEFRNARAIFRTNGSQNIHDDNFMVGILYGKEEQLNANYKRIIKNGWDVMIGKDFWFHLTGDQTYYDSLIQLFQKEADKYDFTDITKQLISRVTDLIKNS